MTARRTVVVDNSAPVWAKQLETDLNASLTGIAADTAAVAAQAVTPDKLPSGTVIQTVATFASAGSTTSSTSYVDVTGASLSITPLYATSRILIQASAAGLVQAGGAGVNTLWQGQILRGSTALDSRTIGVVSGAGTNMQSNASASFVYMDSPATTSSVTYKVQHRTTAATGAATTSGVTIVLQEIK